MLAVGARCRSMWLAARGDVVAAMRIAEHAMAVHARLPMPFERARTQLLLGQLERRQRQKDASSNTFREALRAFDAMGAALRSPDSGRTRQGKGRPAPGRRRTHAVRAAGGRAGGIRHDQPRCGRRVVHQPKNRRGQPGPDYPQTRYQFARELGRVIGDL